MDESKKLYTVSAEEIVSWDAMEIKASSRDEARKLYLERVTGNDILESSTNVRVILISN